MFGDFLKNLGSSKQGGSVVGIDIGAAFLKVVQLKKKNGRAVLETYGELALGPYANLSIGQATNLSAEKISEALTDLFREANITTTNAAISIPLSASLLSVIEIPAIDEKQIEKIIPIEARKYIPVPITEVTLDWWIIPKANKKEEKVGDREVRKAEVMVVAIHNETLNKYSDVTATMKLQNAFFELEVFSTARSTFGNTLAPVMVVDIGAGHTKLAIVEQGIIRGQHIISRGSQDVTLSVSRGLGISIDRAEQLKREVGLLGTGNNKGVSDVGLITVQALFSEANRILLNYQRKSGKPIGHIVLSGGGSLLKGLHEVARQTFETDVRFADPFSRVQAPAFLEPVLKDAGPEFATAIGLALRKLQEVE